MTQRPYQRDRAMRAFALPLVLMLVVGATLLVTLLLTRRSTSRTAVNQQSSAYVAHHLQAGLRDFVNVFLTTTKRAKDSRLADGVVGFNLDLEQGLKMEVKMKDLGGAILASADPTSIRGGVLSKAVLALQEKRDIDLRYIRVFGPPRLSLHGAEPEALEALILAIDRKADGRAFADAVVSERAKRDLTEGDIRNFGAKARLSGTNLDLLDVLCTADPNFWWIEARVVDTSGREILKQGGFANGGLSRRSSGVGAGSWSIETWTDLPKNKPFGSSLAGQRTTAANVTSSPTPAR